LGQDEVSERGVLTASDELWEAAVRQATVISRLAALDAAGVTAVDAAADELGLSRRQVYVLLGRWRTGGGVVSDLLPRRSSGGRGGSRLPDDVEAIVRQVLQARYRLGRSQTEMLQLFNELTDMGVHVNVIGGPIPFDTRNHGPATEMAKALLLFLGQVELIYKTSASHRRASPARPRTGPASSHPSSRRTWPASSALGRLSTSSPRSPASRARRRTGSPASTR
jgi:hypothetical protein